MTNFSSHACLLAGLGDPRLGGALPGLGVQDGTLLVQAQHFACCEGTGHRLQTSGDVTVSCAMGVRLKEARRLAVQHAKLNAGVEGATLARELASAARLAPFLERLKLIAEARSRRGLAWETLAESAETPAPPSPGATSRTPPAVVAPPSVWAVALAAAWRFGLRSHVVVLGRTTAKDLVPRRDAGAPQLICLGNVDGLWDPYLAEAFDTLIGYAYGSMTPVFLEINARRPPPTREVSSSTRAAFSRRIGQMKAKSPLGWVAPECVAKAAEVTDGLTKYAAEARRTVDAQSAPKARPPRLPWDR